MRKPRRSGRSASGHIPTYCERNSASLRLALFAGRCIILIPLHRGTWIRSHFTRLAAARNILGCQSLVFRQLWHLYMGYSLSLTPSLTPSSCHPGKIEQKMDLLGERATGILIGLEFYKHISMCMSELIVINFEIHGITVCLRPRVPTGCDSSVAIS